MREIEHEELTYVRAKGALTGLALGDALGMPTQSMSAADIQHYYGGHIHGFVRAVAEQPIAPNMKAGAVTDDTEQAFVLANRLIADGGTLDNHAYAQDLLAWESAMKAKGSLDLLGPSTRLALHALADGVDIEHTGTTGTTNGGAMRAAPIGIAFSPDAPDHLLARMARESCLVTHNTVQGIQATTLVAAAVSFGISGSECPLEDAISYVSQLPESGHWSAKASVLARVRRFFDWANTGAGSSMEASEFAQTLRRECGTSVEANESVAAAFAFAARFRRDPNEALYQCASVGGDTDTIGAMCGAMLGAQYGDEVFRPDLVRQLVRQLKEDNHLDLDGTVAGLVHIRLRTLHTRDPRHSGDPRS